MERVERRLAAILSADIVGYSRLMEADEEDTHARFKALLSQTIEPNVAEHNGRIVKLTGDGALVEFASAVNAIECAADIQRRVAVQNEGIPDNRLIRLRIGVNVGDVIIESDDIYGEGVNIAARVQALADPGSISISGEVFRQVEGKVDVGFVDLGDHTVKNISKPIRVYAVDLQSDDGRSATRRSTWLVRKRAGIAVAAAVLLILGVGAFLVLQNRQQDQSVSVSPITLNLPSKPSIVVLPFANLNANADEQYISDGITEHIVGVLSKIGHLFVVDRGTTFAYKGKSVPLQDVAKQLGVQFVLNGSVQREGDRVRVNVQLVDTKAGFPIWSELYERDISGFFELQDDITRKVITSLQEELTEGQQVQSWEDTGTLTTNFDAWVLGAQALGLLRKVTPDSVSKSRDLLKQALELDEKYAGAKILLAYTHMMDLRFGWTSDPLSSFQTAVRLTEEALELNDKVPDVYTLLAYVRLYQNRFDEAVESAERGIELAPNNADIHATLGDILISVGRSADAIKQLKIAQRLSPHYPAWYSVILGSAYWRVGDHQLAISALKDALVRDPNILGAHAQLAGIYAVMDDMEAAHYHANETRKRDPEFSALDYSFSRRYSDPSHSKLVYESLQKAGL